MFEARKEKKALESAQATKAVALQEWNDQRQALLSLLVAASGLTSSAMTSLILKKGERGIAQITNVGLIEERKGAGQWKGKSSGVSIPIGPVRYRVGKSRGHYVQGAPVRTAVDTGTLTITSQRIVYQGANKSSECAFAKLLGIQHDAGRLTISVSNRQKPTVVHFGEHLDDWVADRLSIAMDLFNGDTDKIVTKLQAQIAELEAHKPED